MMNEHSEKLAAIAESRTTTGLFSLHELERLSDEEFWTRALDAAQAIRPSDASRLPSAEYLVCTLRQDRCLLPLNALHEIVLGPVQLTRFPTTPLWMPGVTAWHGSAIAVIDLYAYLHTYPLSHPGFTSTDSPLATHSASWRDYSSHCLLVAQEHDITLGLLVTAVETTVSLDATQLVGPTLMAPAPLIDIVAILKDAAQR